MTEDPIPGVDEYAKMLDSFAGKKPVSNDDEFLPAPPPPRKTNRKPAAPTIPMTPLGQEVCGRLKEMFYAYGNRRSEDNRSASTTLGPSEIGVACDRRLCLSVLRTPPVSPSVYDWAAWVGTCGHAGLAEAILWHGADSGRYAVEVPLTFPSKSVPKGTSDLLDRSLKMVIDHKFMGSYSLNKLRTEGPSATYRVQIHTYAYGQRLKGEEVEYVAIAAWPRDKSTLDDMYVFVERYDPQIARDAIKRVDDIAAEAKELRETYPNASLLEIGRHFPIDSSECKFCEFHAPGDAKGERGCNARN